VTNSCPDKDKQNPKFQTLVLRLPSDNRTNVESARLPSCGIQCNVGVNDSVNHARDELKKGNTTGVLLHLDEIKDPKYD
jgi:hypothetical protein